jgi:thiol-disulfide isomerase/thioredoxin
MRRITFLIIAALMLSINGGAESVEKPAALTLKNLQGSKTRLSDLHGKIIVLNFWATWCGPCNAEMPMLVSAANSYDAQRVAFVGASVDEPNTQNKIAEYARKLRIGYPIWVGATDDDMKRLQLGNSVPCTAFIDADGIVRARILGQMRPGEIEERVDWLLRNRAGSAPPAVATHLDEK